MDTQNTPIHIKLWHRDFWSLALSNMFLTMSVYMQILVLPDWLMNGFHLSHELTGIVMGSYGIGLFLLGPYCSWLVQHYRRNYVCLVSILVMIVSILAVTYCHYNVNRIHADLWFLILLRIVMGAAFGLAQMVLSSTLVIDKCESFQRTEANHHAAWFGRFALSLGPIAAIIITKIHQDAILASAIIAFVSIVLIRIVKFPFRAPNDNVKVVCFDRFFLPQGKWLFINLVLIMTITGMLLTIEHSVFFYTIIMGGFFLALLSEKFVFADADLKSETITGLFLIGAALVMMLTRRLMIVNYLSPLFIGFGVGIIGSRFLLFFIKLSRHCQRGTSQSTFLLSWELGLSLGLLLGYSVFYGNEQYLLASGIGLTIISLLMYNFFTHPWYISHKNR